MYSTGVAYLLWLLSGFGALGFHRFYLGKIPTGILWMMTGGLGMLGSIYDFFTLPGQVRDANLRNAMLGVFEGDTNIFVQDPSWRQVKDGKTRIVKQAESLERVILRMAKHNKGMVTPSELALEGNVGLDEAKKTLDALVTKGISELRVRQSGTLVYTFPDLMDSDSPLEDF